MDLRKAEYEDLEALCTFAERTFRVAYEALNVPEPFNAYCAEAFTVNKFRAEMEHPDSAFWLAEKAGVLVAYLKLNFGKQTHSVPNDATVQVERIYIEPTLQGHGLGATLMDFVEEQARAKGAKWIWLSVWKRNPRATKFYEHCGYEISGTEIFQLGDDPQVDWVMQKAII